MRAPRVGRVRAAELGGAGGGAHLLQQVPSEELRQGPVPHPHEAAPLPCHPHQQNVIVRWG